MQKILYTMHFISQTSRFPDRTKVLRTTGSATSCVVSTLVLASGVETNLKASDGELAFMESELRLTGPEQFEETGEITFGDDSEHVLRFSTAGAGHMVAGPEPGVTTGAVSWKVEGGKGQFTDAQGFITSNFTIDQSGERSDFHCGVIFVPE
jgi:hypothetical protein